MTNAWVGVDIVDKVCIGFIFVPCRFSSILTLASCSQAVLFMPVVKSKLVFILVDCNMGTQGQESQGPGGLPGCVLLNLCSFGCYSGDCVNTFCSTVLFLP